MNMLFLALLDFCATGSILAIDSPIVQTTLGKIKGQLVDSPAFIHDMKNGTYQDVYEFTGIRFAESPAGNNRFRKPVPVRPWGQNVIYNATNPAPICMQFDDHYLVGDLSSGDMVPEGTIETEDCLFLNLWVPKNTLDAVTRGQQTRKLPVFIWIHGGAYQGGSGAAFIYDGHVIAGYEEIIYVSINYRLGNLGFLYFGPNAVDSSGKFLADGNAGHWDQLEAMKWVKSHIEKFGGDPNRVTIGGQSAGAASVTFHLVSPKSRGYFQGAIVQSGSALPSWALNTRAEALVTSASIVNYLGSKCHPTVTSSSPIADQLNCLRSQSITAQDIVTSYKHRIHDPVGVVDGDFLPREPLAILRAGQMNKVPLMTGCANHEGAGWFSGADGKEAEQMMKSTTPLTNSNYQRLVSIAYTAGSYDEDPDPSDLAKVEEIYRPTVGGNEAMVESIIQLAADSPMTCGTYTWAKYTAMAQKTDNIPVYVYVFSQPEEETPGLLKEEDATNPGTVYTLYSTCNNVSQPVRRPVAITWPRFTDDATCPYKMFDLHTNEQVYACKNPVKECGYKARQCAFWETKY